MKSLCRCPTFPLLGDKKCCRLNLALWTPYSAKERQTGSYITHLEFSVSTEGGLICTCRSVYTNVMGTNAHTHILSSSSTSIVALVSESGSTRSVWRGETDSAISSPSSTIWSSWIGTVIHCSRTVSLNESTAEEMEIRRATNRVGLIKIVSYILNCLEVIYSITIVFPKYHS